MTDKPQSDPVQSKATKIPAGVWMLGFVSLLMDISSELIHSLLPVYLVTVMGASAVTLGLIEGFAEATALMVKVFSGSLSDYLGKRKSLAMLGYGLGALSKPLFAIASSTAMIFSARFVDRIGKGIRGAPRDAMVADLAPPQIRGAAYGLRQALDTVGAFTGPLLALALMMVWSNDFRAVFWVAVIPGTLAVLLLYFGVREVQVKKRPRQASPIHWDELRRMGNDFWWVVLLGTVFTLARFSEAFLVLHAQQNGLPIAWVPMVMFVMSLVYALSAYPFGKLADRVSHNQLLGIGLIVLICSDLLLANANDWPLVFVGVALWGLHMGITQGLLATMVADTAPIDRRGTAFGFFNLFSGLMMLVASVLAGVLWELLGSSYTFYAGALFCAVAFLVLKARVKQA